MSLADFLFSFWRVLFDCTWLPVIVSKACSMRLMDFSLCCAPRVMIKFYDRLWTFCFDLVIFLSVINCLIVSIIRYYQPLSELNYPLPHLSLFHRQDIFLCRWSRFTFLCLCLDSSKYFFLCFLWYEMRFFSFSDDNDSNNLFALAENDLDYMKVEREQAMEVHWSKALQWAQESLICRDIFKQVCIWTFRN